MSHVVAAIALGSNLGDREKNLTAGLRSLDRAEGVVVLRRSHWIETEAVGGPADQPAFLNGAALVETVLGAAELLALMHTIERKYGRDREAEPEPNSPRTLDLDLLWFGDQRSDAPELRLPHPRIEERSFVLEPLAELCTDHVLASGASVAERLAELRAESGV